jgi:hypothetical protein
MQTLQPLSITLWLPLLHLTPICKPNIHRIGPVGAVPCQMSWQRWTNTKYGMLWTNNLKCKWWELHGFILARLTVLLVFLQPTKPAGLPKGTLNWKESIKTSYTLLWRIRIPFESFYHLSITLTLNVIKWTSLRLSSMVI